MSRERSDRKPPRECIPSLLATKIAFSISNLTKALLINLDRLVRWNLQQAIFVDIALIFPGLLQGLAKFALPAVGLSLPASFTETFDDVTFVALLGVLGYCAVSSLLGREPGGIPFVSKAVGDRMPTIDMFDDEGRFIPRQMREKDDEEGGGGGGGDAGGKDEKK